MAYLILGCLAAIGAVIGLALISPNASEDASPGSTYDGGWEWLDVVCCIFSFHALVPNNYITDVPGKFIQDIRYWTY
jgi:hypothetical protein